MCDRPREVRRDVERMEKPPSRNLTNYRRTGDACVMSPAARKRESGADTLEISAILIPGAGEEKESARGQGDNGAKRRKRRAGSFISVSVMKSQRKKINLSIRVRLFPFSKGSKV